jgi:uncharacterized SAM-binding protein YcdF (DUF218 family)
VTTTKSRRNPAAIVVLGCRVGRDGAPSHALARRIHWAGVAYAAGLGDVVIASGGRAWGDHVEALVIARELEAAGVPRAAIHPELSSLTTAENAIFSARIARSLGVREVLCVTCMWHAPRAVECFERVSLTARALPAPGPPVSALVRARRAVHESVSRRLDAWHLGRVLDGDAAEPHPFLVGGDG